MSKTKLENQILSNTEWLAYIQTEIRNFEELRAQEEEIDEEIINRIQELSAETRARTSATIETTNEFTGWNNNSNADTLNEHNEAFLSFSNNNNTPLLLSGGDVSFSS